MTIQFWLRGMVNVSPPTLKKSRLSSPRLRDNHYRPSAERLENRNLMAYDLDLAFSLGSSGMENAQAVATDAARNVLVAGSFNSASLDLDPGPGETILLNAGRFDGFAAKYDPAGNLLWGVQVGGAGNGSVAKGAMDGTGNVLIAGPFSGAIEIGAPGRTHVTLSNGGNNEVYLAKLDPAGNALWATTVGAASRAGGITSDAAGNVYATGSAGYGLLVAKYSPTGGAVWTKIVSDGAGKIYSTGDTSSASGNGIAVDANSNVYVAGSYLGKIDFNPSPTKSNSLSSLGGRYPTMDAFVLKLNATGAYVWSGSMGGANDDTASGVALDGAGNVHVAGLVGQGTNDFDPGQGTLNLPDVGGYGRGYVVKFDLNRNLIWGHSGVGSANMALDATGNVYTVGRFSGTLDADPGPGTYKLTAGGGSDVFVSKLNSSGNFVWAADILMVGPGSSGQSFGLAVDGSENIYITGLFSGTADYDPGAGTYPLTSTLDDSGNPSSDALVLKLVPSTSAASTASATDAALLLFLADDLILPNKRK